MMLQPNQGWNLIQNNQNIVVWSEVGVGACKSFAWEGDEKCLSKLFFLVFLLKEEEMRI